MFEWDPNKDRQNQEKHKIAFADTFAVFEDPCALVSRDDGHEEERYVILGMDCFGRILVVIYTWREECIRVISARKANRMEAKRYESTL
jgi:uncharacterized protein